jgi:hypothetical protein
MYHLHIADSTPPQSIETHGASNVALPSSLNKHHGEDTTHQVEKQR